MLCHNTLVITCWSVVTGVGHVDVSLPLARITVATESAFPWLLDNRGLGIGSNGMSRQAGRTLIWIMVSIHLCY